MDPYIFLSWNPELRIWIQIRIQEPIKYGSGAYLDFFVATENNMLGQKLGGGEYLTFSYIS